ncbi:MAG TPA: hypothetical protein VN782_12270 [Usitatibacter sp.]|nr:hypothetical protein [Usitatibacter sp.]
MPFQIVDDDQTPSPGLVARAQFYAQRSQNGTGTTGPYVIVDDNSTGDARGPNIFDQFDPKPDYSAIAAGYGGVPDQSDNRPNIFDQFDAPAQTANPKIGQPQDLTFAERYIAPVLDAVGNAVASDTGTVGAVARFLGNSGNMRGGAAGRFFQGAADPGTAIAQAAANLLPDSTGIPQSVNRVVTANERDYQAARAAAGSTGFDPMRAIGNLAVTAPIPLGAASAETLLGTAAKGAVQGAIGGAVQPVTDDVPGFWRQKLADVAKGAVTGAVAAPLVNAAARVVSPRASTNPDVTLLRNEGVEPTIGQTLGGWANTMEEKAQSLPIVGDAISMARNRARFQFNNAVLNRALKPIGASVDGAGQTAIRQAGDTLSAEYDDALGQLPHINFDTPEFNQEFGKLLYMGDRLPSADLRREFSNVVNDTILGNMSPNGSMLGSTFKNVDSELGQIASNYSRSSVASERNLGAAVSELQDALMNQIRRTDPDIGARLDAADDGWAQLVRAEQAGKMGKNAAGVFTPAQYNSAVSSLDNSVRRRAVARGTALGQDIGNAAQTVLGNKYPDSGTVGRALMATGALASGVANPAIPAALSAGAAAYLPPVQNVLRMLVASRPEAAPMVANYLRRYLALPTAYGAGMVATQGAQ